MAGKGKTGPMSNTQFFKSRGGVLVPTAPNVMFATGDVDEEANKIWNFGVLPPGPELTKLVRTKPSFWAAFPHAQGKWDGQSTINHCVAVEKVAKDQGFSIEDLIQNQPRGTCGGRAGSATVDFVQCIMIALGQRAHFKRASHAAIYYGARKLYKMLEGDWQDENMDGVASGAVPEWLAKGGANTREELGDLLDDGAGSDDIACKLGAGQLPDLAEKLEGLAKDNVIKDWAPVNSAQELADAIANGAIGIGSDMAGFTMTRDKDGFCRRSGQWAHYQVRVSVGVYGPSSNRKGFGYWQSWGPKTPKGPLLPGHPGNCFGVDFADQDKIIKSGDWAAVWGVPLWEIQDEKLNLPWIW